MGSAQSEAISDLYRTWQQRFAANPEMDLDAYREMFETVHTLTDEPDGVSYRNVDAGGVSALWCIPADCAEDRVIIWTHAGGYVVGSMYTHRKLAGHLAKAVGARALVLDYGLAPERPFPGALDDAIAAYRWLLAAGVQPRHIAFAGDSAGGSLCTIAALEAREAGLPLPAAVMPVSPFYDMEVKGESIDTNAGVDLIVNRDILLNSAMAFLAGTPANDPRVNPLYADLAGLPPMLLHAGGDETLLSDAERLTAAARVAGVDATLHVEPGMQHCYLMMAGRAPEADAAIQRMASWVRPKLGLPEGPSS